MQDERLTNGDLYYTRLDFGTPTIGARLNAWCKDPEIGHTYHPTRGRDIELIVAKGAGDYNQHNVQPRPVLSRMGEKYLGWWANGDEEGTRRIEEALEKATLIADSFPFEIIRKSLLDPNGNPVRNAKGDKLGWQEFALGDPKSPTMVWRGQDPKIIERLTAYFERELRIVQGKETRDAPIENVTSGHGLPMDYTLPPHLRESANSSSVDKAPKNAAEGSTPTAGPAPASASQEPSKAVEKPTEAVLTSGPAPAPVTQSAHSYTQCHFSEIYDPATKSLKNIDRISKGTKVTFSDGVTIEGPTEKMDDLRPEDGLRRCSGIFYNRTTNPQCATCPAKISFPCLKTYKNAGGKITT
jgi:hypothetical protein